jgi:hypothetical protein
VQSFVAILNANEIGFHGHQGCRELFDLGAFRGVGGQPRVVTVQLSVWRSAFFMAEVVRVAGGLLALPRFDGPLGDQQLGGSRSLARGARDPRHLVEAGFEGFHRWISR